MPMRADATSHSYPLRIAYQTAKFLHAAAFHAALVDSAAGHRVRQPNAIEEIKQDLLSNGLDAETWESGWEVLGEFAPVFEFAVRQTVVVSLRSHWDWFVRRLGEFVTFGRIHTTCPQIGAADAGALLVVGTRRFPDQLHILERATGLELMPDQEVIDAIVLMTHVRNLGLHNRWEVDQRYLDSHPDCTLPVGDLRIVEVAEIQAWSAALHDLVIATAKKVGTLFVGVPAYPAP